MRDCLTYCLLLLLGSIVATQAARNDLFPIPEYELRRPLQYYFHLMELKAKFNPMLGAINSDLEGCSSKAGPFCQLVGH